MSDGFIPGCLVAQRGKSAIFQLSGIFASNTFDAVMRAVHSSGRRPMSDRPHGLLPLAEVAGGLADPSVEQREEGWWRPVMMGNPTGATMAWRIPLPSPMDKGEMSAGLSAGTTYTYFFWSNTAAMPCICVLRFIVTPRQGGFRVQGSGAKREQEKKMQEQG
jgi:hypothetical protein